MAKVCRVGRPFSIAGRNQIGDDAADIHLLGGVVVRAGMVSSYRHRPGLMPVMEVAKELRRVFHIAVRIKHGGDGCKILSVKILIDLHAADVDQLCAALFCRREGLQSSVLGPGEKRPAFDIECVRIERSLAPRLRQADRIEDPFRYPVFRRRRLDLPFAKASGAAVWRYRIPGCKSIKGKRRQSASAERS